MNWINYHHLFYFHTIAHHGSIAKASRVLRVGQSALSSQLKQLEEMLGTKLFERTAQRLELTPIGKTVLGYADAIFNLGTEMLEAVKEGRTTHAVRVDLGVLDSVPKSVAHQFVASALELGGCYVSVSEASNEELLQGLLSHRLHLILTDSPPPIVPKSNLVGRCVGELPVIICGAERFRKLKKNFPASLTDQPLLLPTSHTKLRIDLEHYMESTQIHPRFIGESQERELDKRLAISGHALIAVTRHGVESELLEKKLHCIGSIDTIREQVWLISVRRHFANSFATKLLNQFKL